MAFFRSIIKVGTRKEYFVRTNSSMNINNAVYTATPVAGNWAGAAMIGAGAVMICAGALTSMKYSYLNFSILKQLKIAKKKAKCHRID